MPALLSCENVSAGYTAQTVLHDLSLEISNGDSLCILGPNGSGKSTLIRCLSRILKPARGIVRLNGEDIWSAAPAACARVVAVVPQHEEMIFEFTVREAVAMSRYAWHDASETAIDKAMALADIAYLAERKLSSLSGGERQRVLLARALAQETSALLLDEPTAHMDVGRQVSTLKLIRQLASEEKAVAAALHDLNLASAFQGKAILMSEGRIVARGTVEEVLNGQELDEVYGARFSRVPHSASGRTLLFPDL